MVNWMGWLNVSAVDLWLANRQKRCGPELNRRNSGIDRKTNIATRTMFDQVLRRRETEGVAISHYKSWASLDLATSGV